MYNKSNLRLSPISVIQDTLFYYINDIKSTLIYTISDKKQDEKYWITNSELKNIYLPNILLALPKQKVYFLHYSK